MNTEVVILAAGKGSRMKSSKAKVLQSLAGKSLLSYVIDNAVKLDAFIHVVVGHQAEQVKAAFSEQSINFIEQIEQKGTGHAVLQCVESLKDDSKVLILYGDVPLCKQQTMKKLLELVDADNMGLLTVSLQDATGYGRIVRNEQNQVTEIVEQKDANTEQLKINEANTGILAVTSNQLRKWLPKLTNQNAQGEYYLTDIIALAVADGVVVNTASAEQIEETMGVNDKVQLAYLERWQQLQLANELMLQGATLFDPARVDIRGEVSVGQDVQIDVNVIFNGKVELGCDVTIGANCILTDVSISDGTIIEPNCVLQDANIGKHCMIGPFARIRPGTQLADHAKIGNFVETKKAIIGKGSKVNHLSYVGDSEIGEGANIGAGTITCNYDGVNKFKTIIGNGAFVGSNSTLIAPVAIEDGAFIGAGSVISKDAPKNQLTLARTKQRSISGWQKPVKKS
ncbi:bifunctional UDP-N-acetylglucosamine diphosphorylase/glucosamine-1-phosphate N-acetyltransferase GlmU [Marinicellulosiphila megalodicopiae]|uniref:bifunctional UDP-N-acetylglucosamine diphosphorylase/glucosamine-1-phosphate N-acetyltransferase GlmU n=1 Tax=Marinicellulosiphila megalodicopiae TaxID=2724896 RepID=UPI003BAF7482